MLVLFETPAGYALFKVLDEDRIQKVSDIIEAFNDEDSASEVVQLQAFKKFKDTKEALIATDKLINGLIPKTLEKFLKKHIISQEVQDSLAVNDKKLAGLINSQLGIDCLHSKKIDELYRGLRTQINNLVEGLSETDFQNMTLGLAHGLSRYKLKFSTEKVDTMIIQAVSLLEDLDKELNNYMMRLREWFGWHFPELGKILTDNLAYAKTVKTIGMRTKVSTTDLSEILPEEVEAEVKQAAEISMGTEITDTDEKLIGHLAQEVIDLTENRDALNEYLRSRMVAVAPNLTSMVGELVGAKLISHAGSLINLAKYPASTIQILGAEKALFRAMRTKHNTPKYGLIYQASLVGQANAKIKGKVSRTLAAKCSVCIRVDALAESENAEIGKECRSYIESRVRYLENQVHQEEGGGATKRNKDKFQHKSHQGGYNEETDINIGPITKLSAKQFVPAGSSSQRKKSDHDESEDVSQVKKKKKKQESDSE